MGEAIPDPREVFKAKQRNARLAAEALRPGASNPNYMAYLERKKRSELGKPDAP